MIYYKRILWFICSCLTIATSTLISDCVQIEPILTLYKGLIVSPYNTSQNYPENTCIKWVLQGKPGMKLILKFLFLDFSTSKISNCDKSYILIAFNLEHRYCGNSSMLNDTTFEAELSEANTVVYVFLSSTSAGIKFKLSYEFSKSFRYLRSNGNYLSTIQSPTTTSSLHSAYSEGCSEHLQSNYGKIEITPLIRLYLKKYFSSCFWKVNSPDQNVYYELFFESCSLSSGDSIKIYDGTGYMASLIGSYSWLDCPNYVVTTKSSFYIQLVSFDKYNIGDFTIKYIATGDHATTTSQQQPYLSQDDYCRLNISSYLGEITMNDVVYTALRHCGYFTWQLHYLDPPGQYGIYEFIIDTLDLLTGDVFYFYDGLNQTPRTFMKGLTTPYHFTSAGNSVFIRYISKFENDYTRANFTIRFSVSRICPPGFLNCMYGESACYPHNKRCDGFWDCTNRGGDEKDCQNKCGPGEFSCNSTSTSSSCYKESERCNGKESCANYADEMGCTSQQCSADKGLFLCANGRCIYEKWHCDRTSDCTDNSDELDCSPFTSPRVIVAAVVGSLICVLLLVISLGCVCKLYNIRVNSLRRGARHETPLSRQLAEMFHRRAPPPPYHEAMLTSRPYDEAYLELLAQAENGGNGNQFTGIMNDQSNATFTAPRERSQRDHSSRRCRHSRRHRDVSQVTQEVNALINVDNLTVGTEIFNPLEGDPAGFTSLSQLPAFSEIVPPTLCGHNHLESSGESDDGSILEHWHSEDNNSQASLYRDSQLEITSQHENHDSTLSSVMRTFHHTGGTGLVELQLDSDKDIDTASTNNSLDFTSGDKMECERNVTTVDEDSDSDCILADEDDTVIMDEDFTSDTICLLSNVQ